MKLSEIKILFHGLPAVVRAAFIFSTFSIIAIIFIHNPTSGYLTETEKVCTACAVNEFTMCLPVCWGGDPFPFSEWRTSGAIIEWFSLITNVLWASGFVVVLAASCIFMYWPEDKSD